MAYTEKTLQAWLTENPDYNKFAGTGAGAPLLYQVADGNPELTADAWNVWDWVPETPDTDQAPATEDITTTGKTARTLIDIVPDAPSASEIEINLGKDTDAAIEAIQGIVAAYQGALTEGKTFYLCHFLGVDKKSQIYAASVSWGGGIKINFPDPTTTSVSFTPNLGAYNKHEVITAVGG